MSKDIREYRAEIKRDIVGLLESFDIPELTIILGECFKIQTSRHLYSKIKETHKDVWVSINDNRKINNKPIKLICEDLEKSRNNDGQ